MPRFPVEPPAGALTHQAIERALLTKATYGRLRVLQRPDRWIRGAVHDENGRLVVASQRLGGSGGDLVAAADPNTVAVPSQGVPRLEGTWLYGGHWMPAFGHFITETLTSMWTDLEVDGLVFHSWLADQGEVSPWQRRMLELVDRAGVALRIVRTRHQVERLVVPERSYVVNAWAHQEAVGVWRGVAVRSAAQPTPARVYLSRTRHNAQLAAEGRRVRTDPRRDAELDRAFAAHGFTVVAPEELPIDDQIRLAAGADILAGSSGSALHLSAFISRPAFVIEVGDDRVTQQGLPNQRVVDAACGHLHTFIPTAQSAQRALDQLELDRLPRRTTDDRARF